MAIWNREKFNKLSKGFLGRRKNCFRIQVRGVFKSLQYQYKWRRLRRREVKKGFIKKINAGTRDLDISYSRFIYGLNRSNIIIDRKILSDLAMNEPYSFKAVVDEVKSQVKLPNITKIDVSLQEALDRSLIYVGEYKDWDNRDKAARFFQPLEGVDDHFGVKREDYPYFLENVNKDRKKSFPSVKAMKRLPGDYYDDLPDYDSDGDDHKY